MRKIITGLALLSIAPHICKAQAPTASENYVQTITPLDSQGNTALNSVQYFNGLGYPTLSVYTSSASGSTAYTLTTYDAQGRESKKYIPVPGEYLNYITERDVISRNYFYTDYACYTMNHYDAFDRVTAVDIEGAQWKNEGKQNKTHYSANTSSDNVKHYEAPIDGSNSLVLPENTAYQYYPEGSLNKIVSYDADNKSIAVFTDIHGNKILERSAAGDTYYVYNNIGQLRFVLTPEFQNFENNAIFAYEYRYDNMGRLQKKIIPQAGTTQYWYDEADHIAYMQDPLLGYRYRFYLYDQFGRVCVQGICSSRGGNQSAIASLNTSGGICMSGYSVPYPVSEPKLEVVNYYDSYDFLGNSLSVGLTSISVNAEQAQSAMGSQTGSIVYANNGEALVSVYVYDQKGQVVRTVRKGLDNFVEDVSTAYTYTGDVDNTEAKVSIGYGTNFVANTSYTYSYGKKTSMNLSVSHGLTALSRMTNYSYDAVGRLIRKNRKLTATANSVCSYTYDVHGWLRSIYNGGFTEELYYADGLENHYYNGNISTIKWKSRNNSYHGYNITYDESNRMSNAIFGSGDNLTSNRNYFNEYVEYDNNGNILNIQRRGLADNLHGGFGLVDNLFMTYEGNKLVSVRDEASQLAYNGATDFNGVQNQEYPLTYNTAGSLTSDAGRNIAKIDYDFLNNPVRIQFTDGNVTRYIYSATGEKLRVIYQTAVPNISVAIGSIRELMPSEILYTDSIDYLVGGNLTLKNGRIDKFQFDEGYCQAEQYSSTKDEFTFCYYDRDHLGNIRQVTEADGSRNGNIIETANYYPFGMQFCDGNAISSVQSRKYNGKEFDNMHGLNTYDYGARQYNPVTARWDRMDPLCEKYYSVSPYVYCMNNPLKFIDPDGNDPGSFFKTQDEAAIDFGNIYNPLSIINNVEYGASIFKIRNGKGEQGYTYTVPKKGNETGTICSVPPFGLEFESQIHSHGATTPGMENNIFSGEPNTNSSEDLDTANKNKTNIYLSAPNGTVRKYDYQSKTISVIYDSLPNDNNGPLDKNDYKHSIKNNSLANKVLDNINVLAKAIMEVINVSKKQ